MGHGVGAGAVGHGSRSPSALNHSQFSLPRRGPYRDLQIRTTPLAKGGPGGKRVWGGPVDAKALWGRRWQLERRAANDAEPSVYRS